MVHQQIPLPPPRVVPWASWPEFLMVHNCVEDLLRGDGPLEPIAAVISAKISAWRSYGSLPLAVDATGQIAEHYLLQSNVCTGSYSILWTDADLFS